MHNSDKKTPSKTLEKFNIELDKITADFRKEIDKIRQNQDDRKLQQIRESINKLTSK